MPSLNKLSTALPLQIISTLRPPLHPPSLVPPLKFIRQKQLAQGADGKGSSDELQQVDDADILWVATISTGPGGAFAVKHVIGMTTVAATYVTSSTANHNKNVLKTRLFTSTPRQSPGYKVLRFHESPNQR